MIVLFVGLAASFVPLLVGLVTRSAKPPGSRRTEHWLIGLGLAGMVVCGAFIALAAWADSVEGV